MRLEVYFPLINDNDGNIKEFQQLKSFSKNGEFCLFLNLINYPLNDYQSLNQLKNTIFGWVRNS